MIQSQLVTSAPCRFHLIKSWRLQILSIKVGRHSVSVVGPRHSEVFSGRKPRDMKVLALSRGWRLRIWSGLD